MGRAWASGLLLAALGCAPQDGPAYCAADRAAGALIVLDRGLVELERVPCASPRALVGSGAALWLAHGAEGEARPTRLARLDEHARARFELVFRGLCDLAPWGDDGLLALDETAPELGRLWRVDGRGRRRLLGEFARPRAVAARPGSALVGCEAGELLLLAEDGGVRATGALGGPVLDLAPASAPGTWWALWQEHEPRLAWLGPALDVRWSCLLARDARACLAEADDLGAWVSDGRGARRVGPEADEARLELDPGGALQPALLHGAQALYLAPGALFAVEARGRELALRRSQGGFTGLCALAPLRGLGRGPGP